MSFFAQHATVSGQGSFETAEAGTYVCRLVGVDVKDQPSFDNPDVMEKRFQWKFEATDAADSAGNPFRFVKFTSIKFGNDRSGLTQLLDSMFGRRLTAEEFNALDVEDLKAKSWKVLVDEKTKENGYTANQVLSVKPAQRPQAAAPRQTMGAMAGSPQRPTQAPQRPAPHPIREKMAKELEDDEDGLEDPFADE